MPEIITNLLISIAVIFAFYAIPKTIEIKKDKIKNADNNANKYQNKDPILAPREYPSINGDIGEYTTYLKIKGLDTEFEKFLFNLYIPTGKNKWLKIDTIYISCYGIFIIENKNYSGQVYGTEKGRTWKVIYNNNTKKTLYNPILQSQKNISKVKKILCEKQLNGSMVESIIYFNDNAIFKQVPQNSDTVKITKSRFLTKAITKNGEFKLTEAEINAMYEALKIYENTGERK